MEIDSAILFRHSDGSSIALIIRGKYEARIPGIITEETHIIVEEVNKYGCLE